MKNILIMKNLLYIPLFAQMSSVTVVNQEQSHLIL